MEHILNVGENIINPLQPEPRNTISNANAMWHCICIYALKDIT